MNDLEIRMNSYQKLELGAKVPVLSNDYRRLVHKPSINGVELNGDLTITLASLLNDVGYLTEETDPTVPAWAKQPEKPVYTPEEIGAMPNTVIIPIRVSQLQNDSGYYVKPISGIPLSDFAPGVIPDFSSKIDMSMKGAKGGVAELDSNGMVPSHQLPSYVDDVKTYSSIAMFPVIGEDDKIYIDKSTNKQYRWSGDIEVGYVPIASSIALGETAQTAYRGDRGKIAYDHAIAKGQAYTEGFYKVTVNAEGHIVSASLVTKQDIVDLGIPGSMPDVSSFYVKPVTGIPATDLAPGVIPDVSGFYTKPSGGIPATDLAAGVIPDVSGFYTKPSGGIPATDLAAGVIPTIPVTDVQLNGDSILQNGIANIPKADYGVYGLVKTGSGYGVSVTSGSSGGTLMISGASDTDLKAGTSTYKPITAANQHKSVFYALAKLAGSNMNNSDNAIGMYTDEAKQAIQTMLGVPVASDEDAMEIITQYPKTWEVSA